MTVVPKKVLIIRFSSIGDIVLCSPVVRCIKKQWGAEVHFITKSKFKNLLTASPYVDDILTIENKVSEVKERLQEENYDLVVDLHKNIRSQQVRSICKTQYVSFDKINLEKWLAVHTPINLLPKKHLVDRYFEGLSKTGLTYDGLGLDHFVSDADILKAKSRTPSSYAVISLGATYATKRPPLDRLLVLCNSTTLPIVLIGGPDVEDLSKELESKLSKPVTNLVSKVSLGVSSAIVRSASYVVTGDSGMMHIAAAHRRKLIAFWGSTHPALGMYPYYPKGENISYFPLVLNLACQPCSKIGKDTCPKGHFNCMLDITDTSIQSAVRDVELDVSAQSYNNNLF